MTVLCTFPELQGSIFKSSNTYFWYSQYKIANNLYIHSVKITHGDPGNYKTAV